MNAARVDQTAHDMALIIAAGPRALADARRIAADLAETGSFTDDQIREHLPAALIKARTARTVDSFNIFRNRRRGQG